MTDTLQPVHLPAEFKYRLDFYWQSISFYAVTLIVYIVAKALWENTLHTGAVSVVLTDPVVVLLGVFVVGSTIALVANRIARRSIIVTDEGIVFTSRFHERTFALDEIERIALGRDQRIRVRGMFSVVKIRIAGRRRMIRIRPALYTNEHQLVAALLSLRKHGKSQLA
jgi:hypothetical protein